jgi:hypothetical protein
MAFAKYQRQLMWPCHPSTFEVLNTISSFLLMVFGWLSRVFHWSLVMLYNVHELDGFRFGGFEGENKFCNLETLCCDFDEPLSCFFS